MRVEGVEDKLGTEPRMSCGRKCSFPRPQRVLSLHNIVVVESAVLISAYVSELCGTGNHVKGILVGACRDETPNRNIGPCAPIRFGEKIGHEDF